MITRTTESLRLQHVRMFLLALAYFVCLVCASQVAAAEVPPEIQQALQRNAKALSPISISWTQQLSSDLSVQEWLKKVNLEGFYVDEFSPIKATYAWQNGMSYSHTSEIKTSLGTGIYTDEKSGIYADKETGEVRAKPGFDFSILPRVAVFREAACNCGKIFYGEGNDKGGAILSIDSLDNSKYFSGKDTILFEPTYFREAGFVLPNTIAMQREEAESLPLMSIEHGAQVTKVEETRLDDRTCLLLELEDKDLITRFYLDPSCGYVVRQREEVTRLGQLALVASMSDFVQFQDPDVWLPKRCDVVYYTWETTPGVITEKPLAKRTFVVHEIDKRPVPVDRFSLRSNVPGTYVTDSTLPQAAQVPKGVLHYVVPADSDDLDAVIQAAVDRKPFFPKGTQVSKTNSSVTLASLTEEQQGLIQSMIASSVNERVAPVRAAVFDVESLGSNPNDALLRIFHSAGVQKVVNSADIQAGVLGHFDVVIFPGGSGRAQAAALGDKGRQAVQEFVRDGGGYVGICAGSFLATCKPEHLGLVNAKASVSHEPGWVKMELTDAGKSILGKFPDLVAATYGGGPIFSPAGEPDLPDYVPLAFYRTEVAMSKTQERTLVDTPAIIATRFGKGRVLLFSVHPEGVSELESLVKLAILSVAYDEQAK